MGWARKVESTFDKRNIDMARGRTIDHSSPLLFKKPFEKSACDGPTGTKPNRPTPKLLAQGGRSRAAFPDRERNLDRKRRAFALDTFDGEGTIHQPYEAT